MKTIEEINEAFGTEPWFDTVTVKTMLEIIEQEKNKEKIKGIIESELDDYKKSNLLFMLGFQECREFFKEDIRNYIIECQQSFTQHGVDFCYQDILKQAEEYFSEQITAEQVLVEFNKQSQFILELFTDKKIKDKVRNEHIKKYNNLKIKDYNINFNKKGDVE